MKPSTLSLRGFLSDYFESTTIHGFKYIGEANRSWFTKLIWFLIMFVAASLCCLGIWQLKGKWEEHPFIVTFADQPTPIWQIPFPAITICPNVKTYKEFFDAKQLLQYIKVENKSLFEFEEKTIEQIIAFSQICVPNIFPEMDFENRTDCSNCEENIMEMALKEQDIFFDCIYRGREKEDNCNFFKEVLTDEGLCFTFNGLVNSQSDILMNSSHFWTLDEGYVASSINNGEKIVYPRRGVGSGNEFGLELKLYEFEFFDHVCQYGNEGFKISIHRPDEKPQMSHHIYKCPLDQEIDFRIKPKMMITVDELRSHDPLKRQCYFQNEGNLKLFKLYSHQNCRKECLTVFTLEKCGCIKFSMPRIPGVKLCGDGEVQCCERAHSDLLERDSALEQNWQNSTCACLPDCNSLSYDVEISETPSNFFRWLSDVSFKNLTGKFTILRISFKDEEFVTTKRMELHGPIDFLANCGGLLGLFMGISFISVLELVYFCTVRLLSYYHKQRRYRKEKSDVEVVPNSFCANQDNTPTKKTSLN